MLFPSLNYTLLSEWQNWIMGAQKRDTSTPLYNTIITRRANMHKSEPCGFTNLYGFRLQKQITKLQLVVLWREDLRLICWLTERQSTVAPSQRRVSQHAVRLIKWSQCLLKRISNLSYNTEHPCVIGLLCLCLCGAKQSAVTVQLVHLVPCAAEVGSFVT